MPIRMSFLSRRFRMRIQLSISPDYCKDWGMWEVVREVVQNAVDSNDLGRRMKVTHSGDTLRVSNEDVRLGKEVLLLGKTSKLDSPNQRGQFGEGLKIALVAALRCGLNVKIINDDESWTPSLEVAEQFGGEKVLTIRTHQRQKGVGAFTVELAGIPKDTWTELRKNFLFLTPTKKSIPCMGATILQGEEQKGRCYVKGIFVEHNERLEHGYDFQHVSVDRDRRMCEQWQAKSAMTNAWAQAAIITPKFLANLITMLENGAVDVEDMRYSTNDGILEALSVDFMRRYGADAIPVSSAAEATEVGHFGKVGVVVDQNYVAVLRRKLPTLSELRKDFQKAVVRPVTYGELMPAERDNWDLVVGLVSKATAALKLPFDIAKVSIVEFRDEKLKGTYHNGLIQVGRQGLLDVEDVLFTLVHECAHTQGGDGSKMHEDTEGRIFAKIIVSNYRNARVVTPLIRDNATFEIEAYPV